MNSRLPILLVSVAVLGGLYCRAAWTQEEPHASRTVTEFHYVTTGPVSPARVISTERQDQGRKIETQIIEAPSVNGDYEPIRETETETIHVDANTTRVVQHWFSPGNRQLFQVTEEERRTEPAGWERVVRTTSAVDLSGFWQIQERDVEETVSLDIEDK